MKLSQVVSLLLMAIMLVLGVAAELPHHDHHDDEAHSEHGETAEGHIHFQINGVTSLAVEIEPAVPVDQAYHTYTYTTPLSPFSQIDRPPKTAPVTA